MKNNLVSAIVPVFNRPVMVRQAVQSLLNQTYRPIEVIVVDDGSNDETPTVLHQLQQDHPGIVRTMRQENAGPGAARNAGLQLATGQFIQYLDSDDVLHPEKFKKQVQALHDNPDAGVCYCATLRKDPTTGEMVPWARTAEHIDNIFPSFLPKRGWATLTPLWRKSVCDAIGPWKAFRVMEDWEHDLRAGLLDVKPVHVPDQLCTVIDHDENRASGMNEGFTKDRTLYLFKAHESIWRLMQNSAQTDWVYLQPYSRTMFWIARMCGQRGLKREAEAALNYTDEMTSTQSLPSSTKRFRQLRTVLGWRTSVWLAEKFVHGKKANLL